MTSYGDKKHKLVSFCEDSRNEEGNSHLKEQWCQNRCSYPAAKILYVCSYVMKIGPLDTNLVQAFWHKTLHINTHFTQKYA